MVPLRDPLEFLPELFRHPFAFHHSLELVHALYLDLRDDGPVALTCEVSHDLEASPPGLLVELRHCREHLDHRPDFAGLAVKDFANEQHDGLACGDNEVLKLARLMSRG